ncbi:MAG: hypothetical protein GY874_07430 [Desulfobacteraceae bacterium]|nr:hypothetical protein [Desulfobacteraceae bacterium]
MIEKALQPSLETAIDLFLSEFPSLISSYQLAVERKKKLSAPDYTPRSILTKLKLTGSDPEVEESDDFISLTRQFEATKLRAQTKFTNGFIAVAELNCNVALKRIHSKLHDFTCKIAIAHLTMHTTLSGKELLVKLGKELVHNLYENY